MLLDAEAIRKTLGSLGALAHAEGRTLELALAGGAAVALLFSNRRSTRDIDAVTINNTDPQVLRRFAAIIAEDQNLPTDWLNDGVKGYLNTLSLGPVLFQDHGIVVRTIALPQLLAMKLMAWRDDVDISDAALLLSGISGSRDDVWARIAPFLLPGRELKARYAFDDLWDTKL